MTSRPSTSPRTRATFTPTPIGATAGRPCWRWPGRAKSLAYKYLGVTDHSPRIKVVNGLDAERLLAQSREREQVEKEVEGLALLQGIEVDILEDGALDLPDAVLELLDVVVASPHVKLRQETSAMTERMLRAVSSPHADIVGHPTGRRLGSRPGATYDFEAVFRQASEVADRDGDRLRSRRGSRAR